MKNEEEIDFLNSLEKDELVFYVYKVIFNCPITQIAKHRKVSRMVLYRHFRGVLRKYRKYENHQEMVAAIQELFRQSMPDSFFDKVNLKS